MTERRGNKPTGEFWEKARELLAWCSPEELRVLRIMAGKEMEKRLAKWDENLAVSASDEKAKKNKAIQRQIRKSARA